MYSNAKENKQIYHFLSGTRDDIQAVNAFSNQGDLLGGKVGNMGSKLSLQLPQRQREWLELRGKREGKTHQER